MGREWLPAGLNGFGRRLSCYVPTALKSTEGDLDVEGAGAVASVCPGVEFEIVGHGIFGIEADYDWFVEGEFACGEVASVGFGGKIFVPIAGDAMAAGIVKIVGKGGAEIVSFRDRSSLSSFDVEPGDDAVSGGPGEGSPVKPKAASDYADDG